jgi:hypothetical protein
MNILNIIGGWPISPDPYDSSFTKIICPQCRESICGDML